MTALRVLVASYVPPGHLFGPLSTALALRDLGHEVTYWTPTFGRGVVEGMELPTTHHGHWDGGPGVHRPDQVPGDQAAALVSGLHMSYTVHLEDQLAEFDAALDDVRPDAVVCGSTVVGLLLATERRHVPCVALTPSIYFPAGEDIPPPFFGLRPLDVEDPATVAEVRHRWASAEAPVLAEIAETRRTIGLAARPGGLFTQMTSPDRTLVPSTPDLDFGPRALPPEVVFAGDCVSAAASAFAPEPDPLPALRRPTVLVTSGTNPRSDLVAEVTGELAAMGFGVVALSWSADVEALHDPPRVVVSRYLPMAAVLDQVDVVVTNGGAGGIVQALAHGCPLVVRPDAADQCDNAVRIAHVGVGRYAASTAEIALLVREVLDDADIAARTAAVRDDLAARGGPATAADHVVSLVREEARG